MTEGALVSLVAMIGWLVLVGSALRARQLGARRIVVLALTWAAIFSFVAWVFWLAGR